MKYIIYISKSDKIDEINNSINEMKCRNEMHDITGLLFLKDGLILQYIEGPEREINNLWHNIQNDPRHRDIHKINEETIKGRLFPNWGLGVGFKNTHNERVNEAFRKFHMY